MASPAMNNILAALLAFDTTSRHSNLAMINWIADFLAARGVASRRFYDPSGGKANLYARLGRPAAVGDALGPHRRGPGGRPGLERSAFSLTERDGRYCCRGSADMKGFLACVLAAVDDFLAAPLRMPLHLAFSYDEEVGCLGVRSLGGFSAGLAGETGAVPHRRADRDAAGVRS
ncbi:M20/M25/M40 family metallo-hydrolase [Klebsiella pneumoniae subsp. pneumoniae]|nr:M20/M25/M40 family metallo-hydrolase [Klebsiella pneumoniae subsp. pneumoniae]